MVSRKIPACQVFVIALGKGVTERGPTERGPTERGPTERGPTERGPTERGPKDYLRAMPYL